MKESFLRSSQNALRLPAPVLPSSPILVTGVSMALSPPPRALLFDVFGTCVDWRTTVTNELNSQSHVALNSATASLASSVRLRASEMAIEDWGSFAQQWRDTYKKFTKALAADPVTPWKSVDEHHLNSLRELLVEWQLEGLWSDEEVRALSLIWHRLDAWDDSASGVAHLNKLFSTCTLSNGNLSLLADLRAHSTIPFTHIFSAEDFGSYKPSPRVYLGAVEKLQLPPSQCAMVAAHLNDLEAAKACGLQTIYVERAGEEDWDDERVETARRNGWVDLWIGRDDKTSGFITVAERLGIDTSDDSSKRLSSSAPVGSV